MAWLLEVLDIDVGPDWRGHNLGVGSGLVMQMQGPGTFLVLDTHQQCSYHCCRTTLHWLRMQHGLCAGANLVVHRQGPGIFLQGLDTYNSNGLRLPSNQYLLPYSTLTLLHLYSCIPEIYTLRFLRLSLRQETSLTRVLAPTEPAMVTTLRCNGMLTAAGFTLMQIHVDSTQILIFSACAHGSSLCYTILC